MKPRWKAYLFRMVFEIGPTPTWVWCDFDTREIAVRVARKNAVDVASLYGSVGPIEESLENGGVLFRIPGVSDYKRWPRVLPLDEPRDEDADDSNE